MLRVIKVLEERLTTCVQNMLHCGSPRVFKHNRLIVALRKVGKVDGVEELVGICLLGN